MNEREHRKIHELSVEFQEIQVKTNKDNNWINLMQNICLIILLIGQTIIFVVIK